MTDSMTFKLVHRVEIERLWVTIDEHPPRAVDFDLEGVGPIACCETYSFAAMAKAEVTTLDVSKETLGL